VCVKPPQKFRSFDKVETNSQFRGKYIRNNLIRIRVSLICKLSRTPNLGAAAPRSPFSLPLSSTEFVEPPPPPNKITGYATAARLVLLQSSPKIATVIQLKTASPFPTERLGIYVNEYHNQPTQLLRQPLH
jgi:hypothetical protein